MGSTPSTASGLRRQNVSTKVTGQGDPAGSDPDRVVRVILDG